MSENKKSGIDPTVSQAAAKLGEKGGNKGGPARAKKLTASERMKIAIEGANARWKKSIQSDNA